ncbi:MAG: hypothetical protein ACR2J9_03545, partial [Gaiellales bacterium]
MASTSKIFYRSLATTTLVGAALFVGSGAAQAHVDHADRPLAPVAAQGRVLNAGLPGLIEFASSEATCIAHAERMAAQLLPPPTTVRVRQSRVSKVIAQIKRASAPCVGRLFGNGTAAHPDAGILGGNGFSYSALNCKGTAACDGGDGGRLQGNGGNGFNGGDGGDAGWYGAARAGNGGDAVVAGGHGGAGGRAGRYGDGGNGGAGLAGGAGGTGGTGGLISGDGGRGGNGGAATLAGQIGG